MGFVMVSQFQTPPRAATSPSPNPGPAAAASPAAAALPISSTPLRQLLSGRLPSPPSPAASCRNKGSSGASFSGSNGGGNLREIQGIGGSLMWWRVVAMVVWWFGLIGVIGVVLGSARWLVSD
ncbi:hypothetical protein Droror1_Dr00027680 [Drosera rotundifolia]